MNKFSIRFGFIQICIVFFGLILILSGCKGEVTFSTASLSEAVICISVDQTSGQPIEKGDVFTPNTPEILCSVKLSNAPEDTLVLSQWIYEKGDLEGVTDHKIDEFSLSAKGTTYLWFSLSRPDNGFPKGDYICRLFLNGKEKFSVPFKVQ